MNCHVCGDLRDPDKISVYTRDFSTKGMEAQGTHLYHFIRFCNDRQDCVAGSSELRILYGTEMDYSHVIIPTREH